MQRKILPIILAGSVGTLIEWAEYAFYGYMAFSISKLFFPHEDTRAGILIAFAVFAVGFIMRPLGAVCVGYLADYRGRKKALTFSMVLMGAATFAIGLLPSYQTMGLWAPSCLIVCRLAQGFAVSSECLGAAVFLIEHYPSKPYLMGSWPGMASALGVTLGGMAALLVERSHFSEAWRIPFILGATSCFVGLYIRLKIDESPLFKEAEANRRLMRFPLKKVFQTYRLAMFKTAVMGLFVSTLVYVCNLYFSTYLTQVAHLSTHDALLVTTVGECWVVLFFPIAAMSAEKWGGDRMMQYGLFFFIFAAPILFLLAATGSMALAFIAQFIYACLDAMITAPMFKWLYDLFPTHLRVTGVSVSWNIAVALLGGTSPLIVQYFVGYGHWNTGPGFYMSAIGLIMWGVMQLHIRKRVAANSSVWQPN